MWLQGGEVILQDEADLKPLRSLQVFQGHIAHTGATVANPIHTNLPTQGLTELDMGKASTGKGEFHSLMSSTPLARTKKLVELAPSCVWF
jgi:hypothetical protein